MRANDVWKNNLRHVLHDGETVYPRPGSKYTGSTLEVIDFASTLHMHSPVVTCAHRKLNYRFMAAEAFWILSGDDRVDTIVPYMAKMADFSDNGRTFFGAYGPKIQAQLQYVVHTLLEDINSRQAVLNIWREAPPKTKDMPCTVSVQWLVRGGYLHCIDTMRSSDLWLGWPYDVFNFSMLSLLLLTMLRNEGIELKLGHLTLRAGSQHLYDRNRIGAVDCAYTSMSEVDPIYKPLDSRLFATPDSVMQFLVDLRDNPSSNLAFLGELF